MNNNGKIFEEEIKKSIPSYCFYYRFKDGTGNFTGLKNENVRFQAKNICDCMVMGREFLYLLELKNTEVPSLPFANIRGNQLDGLTNINHFRIKCYFVVCFRKKERCFFAAADKVKEFIENTDRKSIPLAWFEENAIEVEMTKVRVKYKYNLDKVLI